MRNILLALITAALLSGCALNSLNVCNYKDIDNGSLEKMKKYNAQTIEHMVKNSRINRNGKIVVTTISDIDRIDESKKSSTFGRVLSEDVMTNLSDQGYKVIDLRLRKKILVEKNDGEFVLSRDIKKIIKRHRADAVFTGTYSVANKNVYVNYKLLEPKNGVVLSSGRYILPIDNDTRKLLGLKPVEPKYCEE